jgi:hypothetical protein
MFTGAEKKEREHREQPTMDMPFLPRQEAKQRIWVNVIIF